MSINNDQDPVMEDNDRDVKANYAATMLYYQNRRQKINTTPAPQVMLQSVSVSGLVDYGCMAPVRRTFCLIVMFDLIFIFLLWLVYTQVISTDRPNSFVNEVMKYNIKNSLFDAVLLAFGRFVFLISAYAIFKINHWWTIALTTTISCAFLIYKAFRYDFTKSNTLDYALLIVSFVIPWLETWFLDFKVLPTERKARQIVEQIRANDERSALLQNSVTRSYSDGPAAASFYSPIESEEEDDDTRDSTSLFHSVSDSQRHNRQSGNKDEKYLLQSKNAVNSAWDILNSGEWAIDKTFGNIVVVCKQVPPWGKYFKLSGTVDLAPKLLLEDFFYNTNTACQWNTTMIECKILYKIDNQTDIAYSVAAEGGGGLVKSRDFVNLRRWECRDGTYILSGVGITYSSMPPQKKYVRGENGPGAWVISPVEGDPNKSIFQWLLNTNLKGWLPQALIDQTLSTVMWKTLQNIRKRAEHIRNESLA